VRLSLSCVSSCPQQLPAPQHGHTVRAPHIISTRSARSTQPSGGSQLNPQIKIMAISGGGATGHLHFLPLARMCSALRTLQKPFTLQALQEVVREVLQRETPSCPWRTADRAGERAIAPLPRTVLVVSGTRPGMRVPV